MVSLTMLTSPLSYTRHLAIWQAKAFDGLMRLRPAEKPVTNKA